MPNLHKRTIKHGLPARAIYYAALVTLFFSVAFYFGPHLIIFHTVKYPTAADFTETARDHGLPVVNAMLGYQRERGQFPATIRQLVPAYLPESPWGIYIDNHTGSVVMETGRASENVVYQFTGRNRGWWVQGFFVSGPIPNMPEPAAATSRPARGNG